MTAVRKNVVDKIVVDHRTNLVNHLSFMLLEFKSWIFDPKDLGKRHK